MTTTQLKKYLRNLFNEKEKELADEINQAKEIIHKQHVLEEFKRLNIKVTADVKLEQLEARYGGYDSDWSYRLSNTIKTLSIFQDTKEHPMNLDMVYDVMRTITPQAYSAGIHLKENVLAKLKQNHSAIIGNISGMTVKQSLAYLDSIGIPIEREQPKETNLLAPVDLNFINELYSRKEESLDDTKEQEDC